MSLKSVFEGRISRVRKWWLGYFLNLLFWELYYFSSCLMAQLDFGFLPSQSWFTAVSTLFTDPYDTTGRPLEDISDAFGSQQVNLISWFLVSNLLFHIRVPAACVWILIRVLASGRSQQSAAASYKLASSTVSSIHWEIWTHVISSSHVLFSISSVLAVKDVKSL